MKYRCVTELVMLAGLAMTGLALRPLATEVWAAKVAREPAVPVDGGVASAGSVMVADLLGGLRAAAADCAWLRVEEATEQRDMPATESLLQLIPVLDPRPLYFWVNGERILAYDLPAWRDAAVVADGHAPGAEGKWWAREQAERALRYLDEAMAFHPHSAALWVERANIELNRLGDVAAAAESYRRAWAQPRAPYFTARIHAELLRRLGRKAEALAWLRKLHPQLPRSDESAGADLVLSRIRVLEWELHVPSEQAYRAEGGARQ